MEPEDLFDGYGVEITLKERDDFLKVKETLTRLGVSPVKKISYISRVISCINEESMLYYTSRNCFPWMG